MQTISIDVIHYGQRVKTMTFQGEQIASGTLNGRDAIEWVTVYRREDGLVVAESGGRSNWARDGKTGEGVGLEIMPEAQLADFLIRTAPSVVALKISEQLGLGISPEHWE